MRARIKRDCNGAYRIDIDDSTFKARASYEVVDICIDAPTTDIGYDGFKPVPLKTLLLLYLAFEHRKASIKIEEGIAL